MSTLPLRALLVLGRKPLVEALGPAECARLRREVPAALPALLARLPDFGRRSGARTFLTVTCWLVAFHRALPGRDAATNAALFRAVFFRAARLLPRPIRRIYRWSFFRPATHQALFASVVGGAEDGFDGEIAELGPGDFQVTYTRCGIQSFLHRIDASDLGAHICSLDDVESEVFALGLQRTGTLGRGAAACDFHWRHPGRGRGV